MRFLHKISGGDNVRAGFDTTVMMISVTSAKCSGIEAMPVTVEVNISSGIGIHLIGLADAAVKESMLRTVTALQSTGFRVPGRKIVINLAPADIRKNGSGYDIPIALGIMAASGNFEMPGLDKYVIMGELGLDASVKRVPGALPVVELARRSGYKGCILPEESALEAYEYDETLIFGVRTLEDVLKIVCEKEDCSHLLVKNIPLRKTSENGVDSGIMDFSEIIGQNEAKRGLEIAAAGGHNVLLIGPPGAGKSSLAKAVSQILPPMTHKESVETSKIYSVAGKSQAAGLIWRRPFRSPHHTSSLSAILGGGSDNILPGEISLAHNGILFMDEFCETPKHITEALRAPLEERKVVISRLRSKVEYPASFMLIAATNPCPCGYFGAGDKCTCTPARRIAYLSRLSGPIMDRIDIQLWLNPVSGEAITERHKMPEESSSIVAERVMAARRIQEMRYEGTGISVNAGMSSRLMDRYCVLDDRCLGFVRKLIDRHGLSVRAYNRILKLSRTIADLGGHENISVEHLAEAARYRILDKKDIMI